MQTTDLLGRAIIDIHQHVVMKTMDGWLDEGDVWLTLDGGTVVGVPFSLDADVYVRTLPPHALSIFPSERPTIRGYRRFRKFWIPCSEPTAWDHRELRGQRIVDIISVGDDRYAYVALATGSLVSMVNVAPHGTGSAGVELVRSIAELEERWGAEIKRLSAGGRSA